MDQTGDELPPTLDLDSLDQLLHCGTRGTHLLFSTDVIREAFASPRVWELLSLEELAARVQPVLAEVMSLQDLESRQHFVEGLEPPLRDLLVQLYFGFLDRYAAASGEHPEVPN
ncbi:MAG TPA: hypothetical protein PK668_13915 [Myxococcota bacterium]|nr:hypothetical protein [Myxococcota bacterium]HRY94040.1 hypothetical protein [Myxococcota bacterium]HSA23413.1 hypothetical protein [Myxococcota bacterium]